MFFNSGGEGLNDLFGGLEVGIAQDVKQTGIAKLLLLLVLGFVETIGIDE